MANGFSSDTGIADIDYLLSRGGMDSMLMTIWLIIGCVDIRALLNASDSSIASSIPYRRGAHNRQVVICRCSLPESSLNLFAGTN